jgi:hypothetical protein
MGPFDCIISGDFGDKDDLNHVQIIGKRIAGCCLLKRAIVVKLQAEFA